jgi:hypothetical protein
MYYNSLPYITKNKKKLLPHINANEVRRKIYQYIAVFSHVKKETE